MDSGGSGKNGRRQNDGSGRHHPNRTGLSSSCFASIQVVAFSDGDPHHAGYRQSRLELHMEESPMATATKAPAPEKPASKPAAFRLTKADKFTVVEVKAADAKSLHPDGKRATPMDVAYDT